MVHLLAACLSRRLLPSCARRLHPSPTNSNFVQAVVAGGSSCGWCGLAAGCETVCLALEGCGAWFAPALACPPFWHSHHPMLCEETLEPLVQPSSFRAPPSLRFTLRAKLRPPPVCVQLSAFPLLVRSMPRGVVCRKSGRAAATSLTSMCALALCLRWRLCYPGSPSRVSPLFSALSTRPAAPRPTTSLSPPFAVGKFCSWRQWTTDTTALHSTRARSISVWTPRRILGRGSPSWSPPKRACGSPT